MSGPIIVGASVATPSSMPTLDQMVADIADNLGTRHRSTISSATVSGEPGRWLLVDDLIDDERERDQFIDSGWAYLENGVMAGQTRRIRTHGYEGPYGALAVSRVFQVGSVPTTPASGTVVQLTEPLPWTQVGTTKGLTQMVQLGLKRVWTRATLTITGNGTRRYSLAGFPHITSDLWVDGISDWNGLPTATYPARRVSWEPTIKVNGATITLETEITYDAGTTFELGIFTPADRLVYTASTNTWGYTTNGLVNGTDQAAVPLEQMRPFAMMQAHAYHARLTRSNRLLSAEEKAERLTDIAAERRKWVAAAAILVRDVLPKPSAKNKAGLIGGVTTDDRGVPPFAWGVPV